jgi:hypothetical protein
LTVTRADCRRGNDSANRRHLRPNLAREVVGSFVPKAATVDGGNIGRRAG